MRSIVIRASQPAAIIVLPMVLLALATLGAPAQANITTVTLSATTPTSYTGPCPTTVKFQGTISGSHFQTFTLSFNRFINGTQQVVNVGPQTLNPAVLTVNDSITVGSNASGNTYDQIWVHGIAGGQTDVYSNKVTFAVTCVTPTPPPPPPTLTPPPPVPSSFGSTNDPQVCTAHGGLGGGLACSAGFSNHWLALVWNCNNCKADGYRIYRVDGGQHTLVPPNGAYSKDATVTLAVLPTPSGGFSGKCYTITAYKGSSESNDSNAYCVNGPIDTPIVRSFNLVPNSTRTVYHHHSYSAPVPGCGLPTNGLGQSPGLTVGFIHDFCSALGVTGYSDTMIYQSALGFDLGAAGILLRNSKASVKSATLTFQRDDGSSGSCLAAVQLPTGDWSNAQELIPNNDYISGIPWSSNDVSASGPIDGHMVLIGGGKYSIDVTSAIEGFAKGTIPDYGFLLMGGNETRETSDNNTCATGYGSFGLNVQVLIQP